MQNNSKITLFAKLYGSETGRIDIANVCQQLPLCNVHFPHLCSTLFNVCVCVCVCVRHHGLVPAEWPPAGLIRPRPQTQSLRRGQPELHVPVRGLEGSPRAEGLLEVELHQRHVDFPQKQVRILVLVGWRLIGGASSVALPPPTRHHPRLLFTLGLSHLGLRSFSVCSAGCNEMCPCRSTLPSR